MVLGDKRSSSKESFSLGDDPLKLEDGDQGDRPKLFPAQRLTVSSAYAPLCLEVVGICLPSHQPDEYGTRLFSVDL